MDELGLVVTERDPVTSSEERGFSDERRVSLPHWENVGLSQDGEGTSSGRLRT